jgi:enoyl-CoA hydratase
MSKPPSFETILLETLGRVSLITLNRPQALNALNTQVALELADVLEANDANAEISVTVIIGSPKAFAAGADIKEMQPQTFPDVYTRDLLGAWDRLARIRKPMVAAVSGYALGGGCELAMMCDIILAADNAKFGQPEITLAVIPGMGGSQRLTRMVGQAKAMDLILTGRMMDAVEAERAGLVSRIVPLDDLKTEALKVGEKIASFSMPAVLAAKEAVQRAEEVGLMEGIRAERRLFQSLFATHDRAEGMAAFVEKRPPNFKHQ